MTLKEQSQAVALLLRFYERAQKMPRALLEPDDVQLLDETERFLHHDDDEPADELESHGQRRG